MRLLDQLIQLRECARCHAEAVQRQTPRLLVEQSKHHALAVAGRQSRDAHIDRMPGNAQHDATVLRQSLLGDIELRHHFDARHHRRVQ